jgi:hypothetical protein
MSDVRDEPYARRQPRAAFDDVFCGGLQRRGRHSQSSAYSGAAVDPAPERINLLARRILHGFDPALTAFRMRAASATGPEAPSTVVIALPTTRSVAV